MLVVRTDHLGDMLLTLPMVQVLAEARPDCHLTVLASPANRDAATHHPDVRDVLTDIEAKHSRMRELWPLVRQLRGGFDAAIVVHPTPRLALALALAGIRLRVGTAYRMYSLLFHVRVRQHRRGRPVHEARLNLELLAPLGIPLPAELPPLRWQQHAHELEAVNRCLAERGLEGREWVVLHPGSRGSALHWPASHYAALGRRFVAAGLPVLVTGTQREHDLVEEVCRAIGQGAFSLAGRLSLGELAALLARAALVVGGSTGPTHLAAMLGTATIALYSPLRSQRPERWCPLGPRVAVILPEVDRQCPRCLLARCPHYPCMERALPVDTVWRTAQTLLAGNGDTTAPTGPHPAPLVASPRRAPSH